MHNIHSVLSQPASLVSIIIWGSTPKNPFTAGDFWRRSPERLRFESKEHELELRPLNGSLKQTWHAKNIVHSSKGGLFILENHLICLDSFTFRIHLFKGKITNISQIDSRLKRSSTFAKVRRSHQELCFSSLADVKGFYQYGPIHMSFAFYFPHIIHLIGYDRRHFSTGHSIVSKVLYRVHSA